VKALTIQATRPNQRYGVVTKTLYLASECDFPAVSGAKGSAPNNFYGTTCAANNSPIAGWNKRQTLNRTGPLMHFNASYGYKPYKWTVKVEVITPNVKRKSGSPAITVVEISAEVDASN